MTVVGTEVAGPRVDSIQAAVGLGRAPGLSPRTELRAVTPAAPALVSLLVQVGSEHLFPGAGVGGSRADGRCDVTVSCDVSVHSV